jgi:quaternary ammonium compound-resistance protein SugE
MTRAWTYLLVAGLLEIVWAIALKQSVGLSRLVPSIVTVVGLAFSMGFLAAALRTLPVGTAYTIWTGIGAVGTAVIGLVWLGEPRSWPRLVCIGLIVAGIVGLKLVTPDRG